MSSTEYAELAGLNIALSNLLTNLTNFTTEADLQVADWIKNRIKQLTSKKCTT